MRWLAILTMLLAAAWVSTTKARCPAKGHHDSEPNCLACHDTGYEGMIVTEGGGPY
jgi:hypothetical protein